MMRFRLPKSEFKKYLQDYFNCEYNKCKILNSMYCKVKDTKIYSGSALMYDQ